MIVDANGLLEADENQAPSGKFTDSGALEVTRVNSEKTSVNKTPLHLHSHESNSCVCIDLRVFC